MSELNNVAFKHILRIQHVCLNRRVTRIIDPNGSGKTAILRLLNRLNEAEQGAILYNGENIQKLNLMEPRRKVVMLGQTPTTYPGDIEENLRIGLRLSGRLSTTKQKLKEYLEKVDLHKELQENYERLSGREKQRLCLTRVMLTDAKAYLVNEPGSTLDKETEGSIVENLVHFMTERK